MSNNERHEGEHYANGWSVNKETSRMNGYEEGQSDYIGSKECKSCDEDYIEFHNPPEHPSVPCYKLFYFATKLDYLLIFYGTIGACVHGAAIPVFFVFFGNMIDAFGKDFNNPHKLGNEIAKYSLYFVYLGVVILIAASMEVACWTQTGERQAAQMRAKYLEAMLRQDVGFYDTNTTTDVSRSNSTKQNHFYRYSKHLFWSRRSCRWQKTSCLQYYKV